MIATDRFVYVHQPKTGGTFVTKALFELRDQLQTQELKVRTPRTAFVHSKLKHGTCRDIPAALRTLPIWTTVRNPFDQYVSEYAFGWWRRDEYPRYFRRRVRHFERRYPDYPDLSFRRFLQLYHEAFGRSSRSKVFGSLDGVGWLTERFLRYYARHPRPLYRAIRPSTDLSVLRSELFDVRYLQMEILNEDLYQALVDAGVSSEHAGFIRKMDRVLPQSQVSKDRDRDWRTYYDDGLREQVRRNDALLFQLFPDYDEA